jgi:hypothetical protein
LRDLAGLEYVEAGFAELTLGSIKELHVIIDDQHGVFREAAKQRFNLAMGIPRLGRSVVTKKCQECPEDP